MKELFSVCCAVVAAVGLARGTGLGPLPESAYPDTEAVTNRTMAFGVPRARLFSFTLGFDANPSNNVQVAFGKDSDGDGRLGFGEDALTVAWDCGAWVVADAEGEELASSPAVTACGRKSLCWQAHLADGPAVCALDVRENGESVLPGLASCGGLYDPDWDTVRLTVRGVTAAREHLSLSVRARGTALIVR